jgi:hypothetical protein
LDQPASGDFFSQKRSQSVRRFLLIKEVKSVRSVLPGAVVIFPYNRQLIPMRNGISKSVASEKDDRVVLKRVIRCSKNITKAATGWYRLWLAGGATADKRQKKRT